MAITSARMQMRRGLEADFDPDKMQPGEWAVSLDKKYVRMCFSVGVCVRMATYDAFEEDMAQIEAILKECKTIEEAITVINTEVSANAKAVAEYTEQAKKYRDEAKAFRDEAESIVGIGVATKDKAGIVKPDGETITVDEDGTIHSIGGGGTAGTTDYEDLENKPSINGIELSGNKTLSELGIASADDLSTANENINVNSEKISEVEVKVDTIIEKAELNIKNSAKGENLHLTDSANSKVVEFGLYGKATQDGEPTPDNPIEIVVSGSDGNVEVVSCRKNVLKNEATTKTFGGVTFTVNDGTITLNGTATINIGNYFMSQENIDLTNLIASCEGIDGVSGVYFTISNGTENFNVYNGTPTVQLKGTMSFARLYVDNGSTFNNVVLKPMISVEGGEYEPYKETVSTIPTPDGLAGIPVESGGNYTDENGQQWICDEIVKYSDGTGKRIQRVGKVVFDGSDDESWTVNELNENTSRCVIEDIVNIKTTSYALCNLLKFISGGNGTIGSIDYYSFALRNTLSGFTFRLPSTITTVAELRTFLASNNVVVYYCLAEPIITDLSAEEIAEIEKLHTFYPITNISNYADCGMAVTYIADSKLYIDNQLAIQKAQQEEALATMLLLMPEEVQASMIENDTNNLLNESEV